MSAQTRILARVQLNPEILTDKPGWVAELVTRAITHAAIECHYDPFPGLDDDEDANDALDLVAIEIAEAFVATTGLEGLTQGTTPWGAGFSKAIKEEHVQSLIMNSRKLWSTDPPGA